VDEAIAFAVVDAAVYDRTADRFQSEGSICRPRHHRRTIDTVIKAAICLASGAMAAHHTAVFQ